MKKSILVVMGENARRNAQSGFTPSLFGLLFLNFSNQIKPIGILLVDLSAFLFVAGLIMAIRKLKNEKLNHLAILGLILSAAYVVFFVLYYRVHMLPGISS